MRLICRLLPSLFLLLSLTACPDTILTPLDHNFDDDDITENGGGDDDASGSGDDDATVLATDTPTMTPTAQPDADGDGVPDVDDCGPDNADVFEGNKEVCDGIDNDCNDLIDEGEVRTFYQDKDGDDFGTTDSYAYGCEPPEGYALYRGDCNDDDATIYPGATDLPDDGIDSDCGGGDDQQQTAGDEPSTPDGEEKHLTIQEALDASHDGENVFIFPGVYLEHDITFRGKAVALISISGASDTTVDADHLGRGFVFDSHETETSIMDGFTIRNGLATDGGGIQMKASSPTIQNTVITGNTANEGGGISIVGANPILFNLLVSENNGYDGGGGIMMDYAGPTIAHCTISENLTYQAGGGIYAKTYSSPHISNSRLIGNTGWLGAGINLYLSQGDLSNVFVAYNTSMDRAGGIYFDSSSSTLTNVAVVQNSAVGYGGGVYVYASSPHIDHSVIAYNTTDGDGGGIYLKGDFSKPVVTYSILAFNESRNLYNATIADLPIDITNSDMYASDPDDNHNLSVELDTTVLTVDPGFLVVYAEGSPANLHLGKKSPLLDLGGDLDPDLSQGDFGIYGGELGDRWDLDSDQLRDYFWPGAITDAPKGYAAQDFDCNDFNPSAIASSCQ